ncbi:MAG: ParB/RepB/Spo0J family partition protein [Candidatus Sungbacteria bacterium]|nr:ParB/RepB/Spo0J family partition protein [Candidatus Sungbacteria bacterium]
MDPLGKGLESLIPDRTGQDHTQNEPTPPTPAAVLPTIAPILDPANEISAPDPMPLVDPSYPPVQQPSTIVPPIQTSSTPQASTNGDASGGTSAPLARSYEDHFTPRRGESVFWIELEKIEANPFQPRREFNEEALQDLARSIREHGVLQPILVTKREIETSGGLEVHYQLIAGERRWRASKLAGLSQIPAIIRRGVPDDRVRLELAIIENVQREDLNAIERARAYKQLIDEFHLVQREIAVRIGKSREAVANVLRLLSLPLEVQSSLNTGIITEGHARAILMAGDDPAKQLQVYHDIISDHMSVRAAEAHARQVGGKTLTPRKRPSHSVQDPELRDWQNRLQEQLGTKVQLQRMGERGKIVVEFFSEEELRGILSKMISGQRMET